MEKKAFGKKLGERIRILREKKGISTRDFETYEQSIDRHALSRIENGFTIPSAFTLYKIAKVLGVSLAELLQEVDK